MRETEPMIHVFIGTKAQYIKTAPVLRELDARGIPYRLIDSGQHGALSVELRRELGLRDPDFQLGTGRNIATIPQAISWASRIALLLFQRKRVRMEIFDDIGGACVVHGDTPSTLLSALLARRAGLAVAHLEAGLTSGDWRHPFPEEIIRRIVHGRSDVLFAPSSEAFAHLQGLGLRGHIIQLPANTGIESVHWSGEVSPRGPVVMTTHRVENLRSAHRMRAYVELVGRIAESHAVLFVMHDPTEAVLRKLELLPVLESMRPRVELAPLMAHGVRGGAGLGAVRGHGWWVHPGGIGRAGRPDPALAETHGAPGRPREERDSVAFRSADRRHLSGRLRVAAV